MSTSSLAMLGVVIGLFVVMIRWLVFIGAENNIFSRGTFEEIISPLGFFNLPSGLFFVALIALAYFSAQLLTGDAVVIKEIVILITPTIIANAILVPLVCRLYRKCVRY